MEAARLWAIGRPKTSAADDLEIFGAPPDLIEEDEEFEIFEDNWSTFMLFLRLATQWKVGGMGSLVGLDYTSLDFLFKLYEVSNKVEMFEDINAMELAVLNVVNKKEVDA